MHTHVIVYLQRTFILQFAYSHAPFANIWPFVIIQRSYLDMSLHNILLVKFSLPHIHIYYLCIFTLHNWLIDSLLGKLYFIFSPLCLFLNDSSHVFMLYKIMPFFSIQKYHWLFQTSKNYESPPPHHHHEPWWSKLITRKFTGDDGGRIMTNLKRETTWHDLLCIMHKKKRRIHILWFNISFCVYL